MFYISITPSHFFLQKNLFVSNQFNIFKCKTNKSKNIINFTSSSILAASPKTQLVLFLQVYGLHVQKSNLFFIFRWTDHMSKNIIVFCIFRCINYKSKNYLLWKASQILPQLNLSILINHFFIYNPLETYSWSSLSFITFCVTLYVNTFSTLTYISAPLCSIHDIIWYLFIFTNFRYLSSSGTRIYNYVRGFLFFFCILITSIWTSWF